VAARQVSVSRRAARQLALCVVAVVLGVAGGGWLATGEAEPLDSLAVGIPAGVFAWVAGGGYTRWRRERRQAAQAVADGTAGGSTKPPRPGGRPD
jgi:hypothetical protein